MKTSFQIRHAARSLGLALALGAGQALAQFPPAPGPEHEALKKFEGTWTAKVKTGGDESTGVSTYKMECGGLWLSSDFQGEFGGQKFQGRGLDGYDPEKKEYVSVWVDSFSTRPLFLKGTMDKEKKMLTMTGEGPGPDGKPMKYRNETTFPDADHMVFSMYMVDADGKANKMMTIEYPRKK